MLCFVKRCSGLNCKAAGGIPLHAFLETYPCGSRERDSGKVGGQVVKPRSSEAVWHSLFLTLHVVQNSGLLEPSLPRVKHLPVFAIDPNKYSRQH